MSKVSLMIDVKSMRESYERMEIADIGSAHNKIQQIHLLMQRRTQSSALY